MKHRLRRKAAHTFYTAVVKKKKIFTTEVWPRKYKQRRRTPLLFLTGKSPGVIFPLPWNKSMKQSSLWTIAHLLKSDAGRGGSHHRADSVCWQRMPLITKKKKKKDLLWNRCPSMSSVWRCNSPNWLMWAAVCWSQQPFGSCKHLPKSKGCIQRKQWSYLRKRKFDIWFTNVWMSQFWTPDTLIWTGTMEPHSSAVCATLPPGGDAGDLQNDIKIMIFTSLYSLIFGSFKDIWTCRSCQKYTLTSQLKLWSHLQLSVMFPDHWTQHTQSTQFPNPAYPLYQHMEVLLNPYLRAAKRS